MTARRGATYSATGGAADRLGVANVVHTTTIMREQAEGNTTNTTPDNTLGVEPDKDLRPGELNPIGDAILPLLLMLSFYAAYCFIRRKSLARSHDSAATVAE